MSFPKARLVLVAIAHVSLGLCLGGCSGGSELPGDTGTVEGIASYQGAPIPEGSSIVMIHRGRGIVATGRTNAAGEFDPRMRGGSDILVGEYDVYIQPPGELPEEIGVLTPENVPDAWNLIPQKYWNQSTSPATFVVEPGTNVYDLFLED